jgi:hypothetical protein
VTGRLGGYPESGVRHGPLAVIEGFASSLLAPGLGLWLPGAGARAVGVVEAILILGSMAGVAIAVVRLPSELRPAVWIGLTWLGGLLALWIATHLFAPRLMYPALVAFALVVLAPLRAARRTWPWLLLPLALVALALAVGPARTRDSRVGGREQVPARHRAVARSPARRQARSGGPRCWW